MSGCIIKILGGLAALITLLLTLFVLGDDRPSARAIIGMLFGLIILWIIIGGSLMLKFRDAIKTRVQQINLPWRTRFVLFAILLALTEEAITTSMTNLAPLFGVKVGEAYITASANYFDVVLFHSVIVFVPMFMTWGWLLARYDFSPNAVFLLFGITGTLAETISFGTQNLLAAPVWIYIYGLMVYLPAYTLPTRDARPPRLWHYPLAVIFPILCAIPLVIVISQIHPTSIHFPPIE